MTPVLATQSGSHTHASVQDARDEQGRGRPSSPADRCPWRRGGPTSPRGESGRFPALLSHLTTEPQRFQTVLRRPGQDPVSIADERRFSTKFATTTAVDNLLSKGLKAGHTRRWEKIPGTRKRHVAVGVATIEGRCGRRATAPSERRRRAVDRPTCPRQERRADVLVRIPARRDYLGQRRLSRSLRADDCDKAGIERDFGRGSPIRITCLDVRYDL